VSWYRRDFRCHSTGLQVRLLYIPVIRYTNPCNSSPEKLWIYRKSGSVQIVSINFEFGGEYHFTEKLEHNVPWIEKSHTKPGSYKQKPKVLTRLLFKLAKGLNALLNGRSSSRLYAFYKAAGEGRLACQQLVECAVTFRTVFRAASN
jgi:hypothetical protein